MTRKRTTRRRSSRGSKRKSWLPRIQLTLDQQLDIAGYALLAVAGLTILSFLSANQGEIPSWWLRTLRRGFGWGAYLVPLFVGAAGLWLVLREFGERLPSVTPFQVMGVLLGYLAMLATLHVQATLGLFGGDPQLAADDGLGGGHLGALLSGALNDGLGSTGMIVVLVTWWLIAIGLTFRLTLQDAADGVQLLLSELQSRRAAAVSPAPERRQALPDTPPEEEPPPDSDPDQIIIRTVPSKPSAAPPPVSPSARHQLGNDTVWRLPSYHEILDPGNGQDFSAEILRQQAHIIEETLASLDAPVRVVEINPGPVVTQFGVEPLVVRGRNGKETKVKVGRISSLADDLALAMEAKTLRVEAPIPGRGLVGIEVPNPEFSLVALRDVIESGQFRKLDSPLRVCLGQDVSGDSVVADLATMPHLLIAGTTGSGKSVCLNAIIAALLLQNTPDDLRFLMVDPKRVELTGYDGIPHLLTKVVVDMERVASTLQWVLREMDGRYRRFSETRATNIRDYNQRVAPRLGEKRMTYIVMIVDELADMMMTAPQETERAICRIAQMARATGIHLVIATQRPSVDVVTGLIKANFPARIAFNVASAVDSRVILDVPGAERLLGRGDMLFIPPTAAVPIRLQGAFVSDIELSRLVQHWKEQARPAPTSVEDPVQQPLWSEMAEEVSETKFADELLPDVIDLVLRERRASISLLQRKLRIGYTRAARIMDILEDSGVVGPQPSGGKAREVFPLAAQELLNLHGESR